MRCHSQAAQGVVQFIATVGIVSARLSLELVPASEKALHIPFFPTQFIEQLLIRIVLLVFEKIQHQVGRLPRMLKIRIVGRRFVAGFAVLAVRSLSAPPWLATSSWLLVGRGSCGGRSRLTCFRRGSGTFATRLPRGPVPTFLATRCPCPGLSTFWRWCPAAGTGSRTVTRLTRRAVRFAAVASLAGGFTFPSFACSSGAVVGCGTTSRPVVARLLRGLSAPFTTAATAVTFLLAG